MCFLLEYLEDKALESLQDMYSNFGNIGPLSAEQIDAVGQLLCLDNSFSPNTLNVASNLIS